jgi:hypothetical protein
VLLHVPSGTYLRLDGSASTIVDLLVQQADVDRATTALADRYDIPVDRAAADVATVVTAVTRLRSERIGRPRRPTVGGVATEARKWWRLSTPLKVAVVRAAAMVVVVEVGLWTLDLRRLADRMGVPLITGTSVAARTAGEDDPDVLTPRERRELWATVWVLDRWVFDGTCLRRALVTGYFLRRRHPELRLGLIGEGETSHAWVEAGGMSFNAQPVTGQFTATSGSRPDGG